MAAADTAPTPAEDVPDRDIPARKAHLAATTRSNAGHVQLHIAAAQAALEAGDFNSVQNNLEHAANHIAEVLEHIRKLVDTLDDDEPAVAANRTS